MADILPTFSNAFSWMKTCILIPISLIDTIASLARSVAWRLIGYNSYFISYPGFWSTEEDQIHNGATLHVAYPIQTIPCLLMLWRL